MKRVVLCVVAVVGAIVLPAAAQQVDDIRADVEKHDYRAALAKISRRLPEAKGNPQARYELLMLRGESLVQLRQKSSAIDAFRSANNAVQRDGELNQSLAARGMVDLLTAGSGWVHRAADGTTFDLIDPKSRKAAAASMFDQRVTALRPRIDRATAGDTLGPMFELIPAISGAMALEYIATADITASKPLVQSLGERARQLIGVELDRIGQRTSELEDLSNDIIVLDNALIPERRGLHSNEMQELRDLVPYLEKITETAEEGRRINRRLGGDGALWDEILLRTSEAESRVRGVISVNAPLSGTR